MAASRRTTRSRWVDCSPLEPSPSLPVCIRPRPTSLTKGIEVAGDELRLRAERQLAAAPGDGALRRELVVSASPARGSASPSRQARDGRRLAPRQRRRGAARHRREVGAARRSLPGWPWRRAASPTPSRSAARRRRRLRRLARVRTRARRGRGPDFTIAVGFSGVPRAETDRLSVSCSQSGAARGWWWCASTCAGRWSASRAASRHGPLQRERARFWSADADGNPVPFPRPPSKTDRSLPPPPSGPSRSSSARPDGAAVGGRVVSGLCAERRLRGDDRAARIASACRRSTRRARRATVSPRG
jgi:hypothetical protein